MLTRTIALIGAAMLLAAAGCKTKGEAKVQEPVIIEEEPPEFGSVEEQRAQAPVEGGAPVAAATTGGDAAPAEKAWGLQVAELSQNLVRTAVTCNEKFFKALKPDELMVGKSPIVTSDGVLTVMDTNCASIEDDLAAGLTLLEGKHPLGDALLRHWTLLADMYHRMSRISMNVGAPAKRRELNHGELVKILPYVTGTLVPAVTKAATPLMRWDDKVEPITTVGYKELSPADAVAFWTQRLEETKTSLLGLEQVWLEFGHDLVKADLYHRKRHLAWLKGFWLRRLKDDRIRVARMTTGNDAFDEKLRTAVNAQLDLYDTYMRDAWTPAMNAFADRSTIDEEKLELGRRGFPKAAKALERALRRLKLPQP